MELNPHTERYMICAIILAAGESKRMGRPKLILPFGKKTIIETVINNAIQSEADEVLVVLGSDAGKIAKKIEDYSVRTTVNPDFRQGMLSSIQWGFEALSEDTRAVLVMLGDQPLIPSPVDEFRPEPLPPAGLYCIRFHWKVWPPIHPGPDAKRRPQEPGR